MINLHFFRIKKSSCFFNFINAFVLLSLISFFSVQKVLAQDVAVKPDPRLFEKFETGYFNKFIAPNKSQIIFYNYLLDSSFYFMELPKEKIEGLPKISSLTEVNPDKNGNYPKFNENIADILKTKKINVLKYNLVFDDKSRKVYSLDNTNYVIVFYKLSEIQEKFFRFRKLTYNY